ncbi:hypothetical protein RND71_007392 [Anisodus tanguticus]|uniref:Protein kinase domain-containing protein n=1 Tax=Anisodus tanguticus TaxID=243964 RepID=A0AAE1VJ38_9SOLA|nr:hypothetical protein RND71_007392 [Anisodus tanguticus]
MGFLSSIFIFILILTYPQQIVSSQPIDTKPSLSLIMTIKASLDPKSLILSSWSANSTDPCNGSFEGIACNEFGQVVNISLQGKELTGKIPPEIGQLQSLSGLYLHFNKLHGVVPKEIANLIQLSDLYLNVNNLSGVIPPEVGNMSNLQELHYGLMVEESSNLAGILLTGSIPNQLGGLKNISVLVLQVNQLTGAIPASLGDLEMLTRLDLSFNYLFGSIPVKLADAPKLQVLDIRNNTLSGNVPLDIPESANVQAIQKNQSRKSQTAVVVGVIALFVAVAVTGLFTFSWYRRQKQKIGGTLSSDRRLSTDEVKEVTRRSASPLISLEYSNGWDPLGKGRGGSAFSQEVFESFMFNLDEVESATQYFAEANLLGKSNFTAVYKGTLRDGSFVAIKCISKTSCKSDETEFLKGLKLLTSLKHENLLRLRGFCCSKGRGECFLIYDFVPNGNLLQYLDVKDGKGKVLDWPTRLSIIKGIARGSHYLQENKGGKPALVHRNISAEKVLVDQHYNPLLSDSGLHKLLADDIVFSTLKESAAMGYLAPEYTTTGRFTEKSDLYAFGMIIFQILSGRRRITQSNRQAAEMGRFEDFVDPNLCGNFVEAEAVQMAKVALLCTHESPNQRPNIEIVMQELNDLPPASSEC